MQTAPEHDGAPAQARLQPLFRIDPGWPFVIAGLLLLVAGVLIPAQRDLQELRNTLEVHRALEDQSIRQLAAYDRFLNDLEHGDQQLVERLAASQLNLMPKDERPALLVPTLNATVTQWIEDSEPAMLPNPAAYPDTLLSRLATGPRRLWVLACGAFLVFIGLMLSPSGGSGTRRARRVGIEPVAPRAGVTAEAAVVAVAATGAVAAGAAMASGGDACDASSDEHLADAAVSGESAVSEPVSRISAEAGSVEEFQDCADACADESDSGDSDPGPAAVDESDELVGLEDSEDSEETDETDETEETEVAEDVDDAEDLDDAAVACVGGEPMEVPDAALAADADAMCMSSVTRASEAGASVVEVKPAILAASDDGLPHAESAATIDGGEPAADVESVMRAETEAIPGDSESDVDVDVEIDEVVISSAGASDLARPAANDRALDTMSLFDGLGDDRWISTNGRG